MAVCRFRLDDDDGSAGGGGGDRVAGVLETFLVSLSLLIGDDVAPSQFQHGKPGIVGPSSETDGPSSSYKIHIERRVDKNLWSIYIVSIFPDKAAKLLCWRTYPSLRNLTELADPTVSAGTNLLQEMSLLEHRSWV